MCLTDVFRLKDEPQSQLDKIYVPCGSRQVRVMASASTSPQEVPEGLDEKIWKDLPQDLAWKTLAKFIGSQPMSAFLDCARLDEKFQKFLTVPKLLEECPHWLKDRLWMLKQKCVRGSDNIVKMEIDDLPKERQLGLVPSHKERTKLIPVPLDFSLCRFPVDDLRVSSSQGGECGLIYLEKDREWFVVNPVTRSVRQLYLVYSEDAPRIHLLSSVDRISSGYLCWASDRGQEMYPLLYDFDTETWKRMGSGFTTKGHIRMEKAVYNGVVYLRYEEQNLKDQLIMFDIKEERFHEVDTEGLPKNMRNQYLFYDRGHIYLIVGLPNPSKRYSKVDKIVLYQLKTATRVWREMGTSAIPPSLLTELTGTDHDLCELKFLLTDHELLVASLVTKRWMDGVHVSRKKLRRNRSNKYHSHVKVAAYNLTTNLWHKDDAHCLGKKIDLNTTIFKPRTDIEA